MCPTRRVIFCPLCRLPLSAAEIAAGPAEADYPSHYACRAAMQASREDLDADSQEHEYRAAEGESGEG